MVKSVPALLAKETNDAALLILASSLAPHLVFHLREDLPLPDDVLKLLVVEMQNSKPVVRRAFVSLVGETFWALEDLTTTSATTLARAVFTAFESSLKSVAMNPLNTSAGPVEGYVAAAVLLGPFFRSEVFGSSYVSLFLLVLISLVWCYFRRYDLAKCNCSGYHFAFEAIFPCVG
jgi:hypothetical protein